MRRTATAGSVGPIQSVARRIVNSRASRALALIGLAGALGLSPGSALASASAGGHPGSTASAVRVGNGGSLAAFGPLSSSVLSTAAAAPTDDPTVCNGCVPPLVYHGGDVMGTAQAGEITVTPIYWAPIGFSLDAPRGVVGAVRW